jgi:hypothetical protein
MRGAPFAECGIVPLPDMVRVDQIDLLAGERSLGLVNHLESTNDDSVRDTMT